MTFITGMLLIDAPASALNNSGEPIPGARTDNTSSVKSIRTASGMYPYVSAQAVRYWLRNTLETSEEITWHASPVHREEKVAYTDANPLTYWDDDLLGYMRAPSKRSKKDEVDPGLTPLEDEQGKPTTVTRVSPLRVSTFVSIAPVTITVDYSTMSRQDGDPVPYEHQFYRATLQGLISLDLGMAGKFYYRRRTGFQNLDAVRRALAEESQLEHLEAEKAYRFGRDERLHRVQSLLLGLSRLQGGAKQATHYTDVSPAVAILAVTTGGNHPFNYLFKERNGVPQFQEQVFATTLDDARDQLLSPVYVGWKPGYLPEEQAKATQVDADGVQVEHVSPRAAFEGIADWLAQHQEAWDA